jgi:hypothetical protein
MRRQERLFSQRLSEREVQRGRSAQEGGQEEEGVEAWEKEFDMDIAKEREYLAPIPGKIMNLAKETAPRMRTRPPRSKKPAPKTVEATLNHSYPKFLLYQW